jgi:predicted ATPase
MQALSRQNPALMILEDVHWTDPTSLEAFGRAVDRLRTLRVLLIVTFRPEFEPPWIGRPHVTALTLNRLGEREIIAMIDGVTGNKSLPAKIRLDIVERTDGIPLFIEEMTKAVLEAESEGDARQTAAAVPASALAVPASLHASLMGRAQCSGRFSLAMSSRSPSGLMIITTHSGHTGRTSYWPAFSRRVLISVHSSSTQVSLVPPP